MMACQLAHVIRVEVTSCERPRFGSAPDVHSVALGDLNLEGLLQHHWTHKCVDIAKVPFCHLQSSSVIVFSMLQVVFQEVVA